MRRADLEYLRDLVYGGAVLGGGGGGEIEAGLSLGEAALNAGEVEVVTIDEIDDGALVATISGVGAPAAEKRYVRPADYLKAVQLLEGRLGQPAAAFVSGEVGPTAVAHPWFPASVFRKPVLDAPGDGRAHPTAVMGAIGLNRLPGYTSLQVAVGGAAHEGRHVEVCVRGSVVSAAAVVRHASVVAGGVVAVARDPVAASYVRSNAAVGALQMAAEVGRVVRNMLKLSATDVPEAVAEHMGGQVAAEGVLVEVCLRTRGGFDVGIARVEGESKSVLHFVNEFMVLEVDDRRVATFPDLITVFSRESGLPIPSAAMRHGLKVAIVTVPREKLVLGKGILDPANLRPVEEMIGLSLVGPR